MMNPNSATVLNWLKVHVGTDVTSADIAEATGLPKRTVDGIVTSALCRKGLAERIPAEIELEDGTHQAVKFIALTQAGIDYVDAE